MKRLTQKSTLVSVTAILILVATANKAQATLIMHSFTGTVTSTSLQGTGSLPFGNGATVTGSFFYDDSTPFSNYDGTYAVYGNASTGVDILVNGTYAYNQSQANPVYSLKGPTNNSVQFGPTSSSPPELFTVFTGSYDYPSSGTTVSSSTYAQFDGNTGMLSSTSVLSGLTLDLSKLVDAPSVVYQSYTYSGGTFTQFTLFTVTLNTLDGSPLPFAAAPEPASLVLMSLSFCGLIGFELLRHSKQKCQEPIPG